MKDLAGKVVKAVGAKVGLWIAGLLGFSGFALLSLVILVVITVIGAVGGSSGDDSLSMGGAYSCAPTGEVDYVLWDSAFENAGAFSGKGHLFVSLAEKYGIDPVLAAAIAFHETGSGTSNAVVNYNNPGGIMDPASNWTKVMRFASLEAGLEYTMANLKRRIIDDGLVTVEALGAVYAPLGAANDPNNLNANWVPAVLKFAEGFGGLTMNCEAVEGAEIIGNSAFPLPFTKNITSSYGWRTHPITGNRTLHAGIDFASANVLGKPIVSYMDGTVITSGWHNLSGNFVVVDHGNNVKTRYAHMQQKGVPAGTVVKAGDFIGKVGSTGGSTGPHLHFEIHINGSPVNPLPYLKEFLGGS